MKKPASRRLPQVLAAAMLLILAAGYIGSFRRLSAPLSCAESLSIDAIETNCALAESLMSIGDYEQARKYLERNLKIRRHHPHTHFLLGEIYRRKNTIFDRRLSAENLKQAVIRDPDNYRYRYSLGLTYLEQGFIGNALAEFKKVVRLNPDHADAHRHIAQLYRQLGLRYDDRDMLASALDHAAEAAAAEKDPLDYLEQAALLVMLELFDAAIGKIDTAIGLEPDSSLAKKLLLARGLCRLRMGLIDEAAADFDAAMSLMNEHERAEFEDVRLLMPPQEYARLLSMSRYRRQKAIASFWKELDPDLTTAFNERRLEHFARQIYAEMAFSIPEKNINGKNTRRGETYIRFGPPESKVFIFGDALARPPEPSSWIWEYVINGKPVTLRFVDIYHDGDFTFPFTDLADPTSRRRDDPEFIADRLARTIGQRYQFSAGKPLAFKYGIYQFKGNRGATELEIFFNIPHSELSFSFADDMADAEIDIRAALHTPALVELDSFAAKRTYSVPPTLIENPRLSVCDNFKLAARADSAVVSLAFANRLAGSRGMARTQIALRNFYTDRVEISDLILARQLQRIDAETPINRNSLHLFTNLENRYFVSEPVVVYFEFYNLELDAAGRTDYQVRQTIARLKRPKLIGVITGYQVAEEVTTVFEGGGPETFEHRLLTLDFSRFKPGRYRITIEIIDNVMADSATAAAELILYE